MSKYEVKSVVCDYGVFEDNELKLICNSQANALKIKEILETDSDMSKPYVWKDKKISELEKVLRKCAIDLLIYETYVETSIICDESDFSEKEIKAKLKEIKSE